MKKEEQWQGYSYDELRFRRVLTMTKIELQKGLLAEKTQMKNKAAEVSTSISRKLFGALNYVDYALLAFKAAKRIMRIFKR